MMKLKEFYQKSKVTSSSKELSKLKIQTVKKFSEVSKKLQLGEMTFSYGGRPIRALPADVVRIVSQTDTDDEKSLLYKNVLLNSVISSELKAPYSGVLLLDMLKSSKNKKVTVKTRVCDKDLFYLIRKNIGSGICYDITKEILENCGTIGDISFSLTDRSDFSVSISDFYKIEGHISQIFTASVKSLEQCSVIAVDGSIEKVSEIHQLLESSSNLSKNVVIIAKNFFPDVCHTLSENYKTGKLKVIPFQADPAVDLKEIEDTGVFCVTAENYRNISLVNIEDLKDEHDVEFNSNSIKVKGLSGKSLARKCEVFIPKRYQNQSAVIESRIKSALTFSSDVIKKGIVVDDQKRPLFGYKQHLAAIDSVRSFHLMTEKLGCIITHGR